MGWQSRHVVYSRPRGAAAFRYLAPGASQALFECEKLLLIFSPIHPPTSALFYSFSPSE